MQLPKQITAEQVQKLRYLQKLALVSVAAFLLAIFFFCPHFVFWKGLHVEIGQAQHTPEVNRAQQVLRQLQDPFIRKIGDEKSNRVILWRLFFPIVGHYLHFPEWFFLSLPHIGCLFVLGFVAHLVMRERATQQWRDWLPAFYVATIVATCSWFFVATGWLSYNDSWYLLGLLLVSFGRCPIVLGVICFIEPFIDERFVLGIPLAFVLRVIYFDLLAPSNRRTLVIDAIVIAALTVPYVLLRVLLLHKDQESSNYLSENWKALKDVHFLTYLHGLWMGMRAAWVLVIALMWLVIRRKNWLVNSFLIATVVFSILVAMLMAADIGRSSSALVPAGVLGVILLMRQRPGWIRIGLPALMVVNLLLPAENVITLFSDHIYYLYAEIDGWEHPPPFLRPEAYVADAVTLRNQRHFVEARQVLDAAIQLDSHNVPAYLQRALANAELGDFDRAEADADWVLLRNPEMPDALFVRGVVYLGRRDNANAQRVLEEALRLAPENWQPRATCQSLLQQLSGTKSKSDFGF